MLWEYVFLALAVGNAMLLFSNARDLRMLKKLNKECEANLIASCIIRDALQKKLEEK